MGSCGYNGCDNEYPHLHIRPMSEMFRCDSSDFFEGVRDWASLLAHKREHTAQMSALLDVICEEGFVPGYAVMVTDNFAKVKNGHHRLTLLHDLGMNFCPVQHDYEDWESPRSSSYDDLVSSYARSGLCDRFDSFDSL